MQSELVLNKTLVPFKRKVLEKKGEWVEEGDKERWALLEGRRQEGEEEEEKASLLEEVVMAVMGWRGLRYQQFSLVDRRNKRQQPSPGMCV